MPRLEHHIFICMNNRPEGHPRGCCNANSDETLREAFQAALKAHGLSGQIRANKSGCLDQCEYGPTIVIYPQGIWYGRVCPEHAGEIVERTLVRGQVIPELLIPDACLNTKGRVTWDAGA